MDPFNEVGLQAQGSADCRGFGSPSLFSEVVDGGLLHLCLVTAAEHRFSLLAWLQLSLTPVLFVL